MFDQALFDDEEVDVLSIDGGRRIAAALGNRKFCMLRNHGLLMAGRSVEESVGWFVTAEHVKAPNAPPISDEAATLAASTLAPHPVGWRMFLLRYGGFAAYSGCSGSSGRLSPIARWSTEQRARLRLRQTDASMIEVALAIVQCQNQRGRGLI